MRPLVRKIKTPVQTSENRIRRQNTGEMDYHLKPPVFSKHKVGVNAGARIKIILILRPGDHYSTFVQGDNCPGSCKAIAYPKG